MGISGFLLQVLLTEGLQREKAGRATNLIVSSPTVISNQMLIFVVLTISLCTHH